MGIGSSLKRHFSGSAIRRAIRPLGAASTFGLSEVDPGAKHLVTTGEAEDKKQFVDRLDRTVSAASTFGGTEINRSQGINHGQKNDAIFGGANRYQNQQAVAAEKAYQAEQEQKEADLLSRADANYGVGLSPEAQANASRARARRAAAASAVFTGGRQSAEEDYQNGLSDVRANLARSGLSGSGVEAQARNDLLARYFAGITQAQQAGQQAGQQFDTNSTTNRLALRGGIRSGQITDTTGLGSEIAGLQAQGSNAGLWENSLGKFLPVAAQQYSNRRLANAYGGG